ncbi:hypothetical protein FDECE_3082 [Fusarium decemcellulare]|nr:hypothetical protein FDECE_3082 [Fusarium decemcellulare]
MKSILALMLLAAAISRATPVPQDADCAQVADQCLATGHPDDCRESSTCLCNAWTQVLKCLDSESCQSSPTYAQASENVRGVCADPSPLD